MSFQQIGVAGAVLNRWAWWQKALKGDIGDISESHPEQGYYRTRRKDGQWEPVAIWWDEETGRWLGYRNGQEARDINQLWVWSCRHPISHDAYQKAIAGGGFDDEPPAPLGHNSGGSTDPLEAIRIELAGEAEQLAEFLKADVTTQAQADRIGIWAKRMTDLAKRADQERVSEKEPHLAASRAVDDRWRDPIAEAKEWAAKAKRHVEGFLIEQKRKAEEQARQARQEAERQRKAAEAAEDESARAAALQAAAQAEEASKVRNASAGRTGARVSVRTEKIGVVTDYAKAAAALVAMNHRDIIAVIDQLAQRAAKSGMPFDGMEIREQERVV